MLLDEYDLKGKRVQAEHDQALAMQGEGNDYPYIMDTLAAATLGTLFAIEQEPDEHPPVPIRLITLPSPMHFVPPAELIYEAWVDVDGNEDNEMWGPTRSIVLHHIPLYHATTPEHTTININLIEQEEKIVDAFRRLEHGRMRSNRIAKRGSATSNIIQLLKHAQELPPE